MLVKYQAENGLYVRRLMLAISKWAAANDANEAEFAEEVIKRIERYTKLAELRQQFDFLK